MNQETYNLSSKWVIEAPIVTVWQTLVDTTNWNVWWPDVRTVHVLEQAKSHEGTLVVAILRGMAGYSLEVVLDLEKAIHDEQVALRASGDLNGVAIMDFKSANKHRTIVRISWQVKTTKPWMNVLAPALRKVFTRNHHLMMKRGEKGLQKYLLAETANNGA